MKLAPKLFVKLEKDKQKLLKRFYKVFLETTNYPPELEKEKKMIDVIAHNLAFRAVWELDNSKVRFVKE